MATKPIAEQDNVLNLQKKPSTKMVDLNCYSSLMLEL